VLPEVEVDEVSLVLDDDSVAVEVELEVEEVPVAQEESNALAHRRVAPIKLFFINRAFFHLINK
jgi:hypothetical protein